MWVKCMAGDDKAWGRMRTYNKQDTVLLEELYEKLQPWIPGHPSRSLRDDEPRGCPACGNTNLERRGFAFTRLGKFQRYQCKGEGGCGKWLRGTKRLGGSELAEMVG